jgi:predicted dehydrogenase
MKVAIVGAGHGLHVHAPAIVAAGGDVVGICDSGSGSAARIAGAQGCQYFGSWTDLLKNARADIVLVATPPLVQQAIVESALQRRIPVVCEKPFGHTVEAACSMESCRQKMKVTGYVGFQFRFDATLMHLRQVLHSGVIGCVWGVDVRWLTSGWADPQRAGTFQCDAAAGGGVVGAFASHVIDYLPWLLDHPITAARGTPRIRIGNRSGIAVTAEDTIEAQLQLGDISASMRISHSQPYGSGHRIEVYGEKGIAWCEMCPPFISGDVYVQADKRYHQKVAYSSASAGDDANDSRLAATTIFWASVFDDCRGTAIVPAPTFNDGITARYWCDVLVSRVTRPSDAHSQPE